MVIHISNNYGSSVTYLDSQFPVIILIKVTVPKKTLKIEFTKFYHTSHHIPIFFFFFFSTIYLTHCLHRANKVAWFTTKRFTPSTGDNFGLWCCLCYNTNANTQLVSTAQSKSWFEYRYVLLPGNLRSTHSITFGFTL